MAVDGEHRVLTCEGELGLEFDYVLPRYYHTLILVFMFGFFFPLLWFGRFAHLHAKSAKLAVLSVILAIILKIAAISTIPGMLATKYIYTFVTNQN